MDYRASLMLACTINTLALDVLARDNWFVDQCTLNNFL